MHRTLVVVALVGLFAAPRAMSQGFHEHEFRTLGPEVVSYAAGEYCEFPYEMEFFSERNVNRFYDSEGNLSRAIRQAETTFLHRGLGRELTETIHVVVEYDFVTGEAKERGNVFHLRDADGKILYVGSGRAVYDLETGEVLSMTPNYGFETEADVAAVVCAALAAP